MAGYRALASTGTSIVALLRRRFEEDPAAVAASVQIRLVGNQELKTLPAGAQSTVTVYCYKVSVDRETRPGWSAVGSIDGIPRIPLRLHFLLAAWAPNIVQELEWLGLAARILESEGILTGPLLDASGAWLPGDAVQVVTDDIALEPMSEAFQALSTDYRLSLPYIARVICIDGPAEPPSERVSTVAARVDLVTS